jgi:hypothetical protein
MTFGEHELPGILVTHSGDLRAGSLLQRFSGMSSTTPGHPMGLHVWFQADIVPTIPVHICDSSSGVKTAIGTVAGTEGLSRELGW